MAKTGHDLDRTRYRQELRVRQDALRVSKYANIQHGRFDKLINIKHI